MLDPLDTLTAAQQLAMLDLVRLLWTVKALGL